MTQSASLNLAINERDIPRLLRHALFREATPSKRQQLVSIYYDTRTLRLRAHGVALHLRKQASTWLQTLQRCDADTETASWSTGYFNHFDFSTVDDAALREWLNRPKILAQITPVFESTIRRTNWRLNPAPGVVVLVTLDRVTLISSGRRSLVADVELRLIEGSSSDLYAVAIALAERVPLAPQTYPTTEHGYRLFLDLPMTPIARDNFCISAEPMPLVAFRQIALSCLKHMLLNHAGAATTDNPEYIHQMRVATRRLRASAQLFKPLLPSSFADQIVAPLRDLMSVLGRVRDLDIVMTDIVNPVVAEMPGEPGILALATAITERQYLARAEAMRLLSQPAYGHLQLQAMAQLGGPAFLASSDHSAQPNLSEFAQKRLQSLCERTLRHTADARVDEPNSLHRMRISIKRLRYAMEFFRPMMSAKTSGKMLQQLIATQEKLGELNDLASAGAVLMACAAHDANLRQAVSLIAAWHAQRHADLLADIASDIKHTARLKLPHFV